MMTPTFTILLPITRPPDFLPLAVESVMRQTRSDWELFIVCDGPPKATVDWANEAAAADPRIFVFDCPKGERNGESHRHQALAAARGTYVAHLADDNLWFPDHLDRIEQVLRRADLGGTWFFAVQRDGSIVPERFLALSQSAYRLDAYRRLPVGWSPAPRTMPSDQFMFEKFRSHLGMREQRLRLLTVVHLGTDLRREVPVQQRRAEMEQWARRLQNPNQRRLIRARARLLIARSQVHTAWIGLKVRTYRFLKRRNLPTALPWRSR